MESGIIVCVLQISESAGASKGGESLTASPGVGVQLHQRRVNDSGEHDLVFV